MNKSILIITLAVSMLLLGCLGFGEPEASTEANETTKTVIEATDTSKISETPTPVVTQKEGLVRIRIGSNAAVVIGKGLTSVNLTIVKIELHDGSNWNVIGSTSKTFDLVQLSRKTEIYSENNVNIGNYNKMRLTLVNAKGSMTSIAAIPGILSTQRINDLDLSDYRPELEMNLEVSEGTWIIKLTFDLENLDLTEFNYLNTADVTIKTESFEMCTSGCETECSSTSTYTRCNEVCILDTETECENDTKLNCAANCGCNLSCETFQQEECRLTCITEGNNSSECKISAPEVCNETCKQEPIYSTCFNRCEARC